MDQQHWDKVTMGKLISLIEETCPATNEAYRLAGKIVGLIAEHRQEADHDGYSRGFLDGYARGRGNGLNAQHIKGRFPVLKDEARIEFVKRVNKTLKEENGGIGAFLKIALDVWNLQNNS